MERRTMNPTDQSMRNLRMVLKNMKTRCRNPKSKDWARYGGRGIVVCERWQHFKNFYDDMFPSYKAGLSIERIDTNGDYEPDNCRWATAKEQANNQSRNHLITAGGKTQNIQQWSEENGIPRLLIESRMRELKWTPEKAVLTPPRRYNHDRSAKAINRIKTEPSPAIGAESLRRGVSPRVTGSGHLRLRDMLPGTRRR